MNTQIWKRLSGHPDLKNFSRYSISEDGHVFSARNTRGRIMLPFRNAVGYWCVGLWFEGRKYRIPVHKLLALVFIQNPLGLPNAMFIDGNKNNLNFDNIEWGVIRSSGSRIRRSIE